MNWISVKDSLPKLSNDDSRVFDSIDVIATDGDFVCVCAYDFGWYCMEQWESWNAYNQIVSRKITHWMYLPEPPK